MAEGDSLFIIVMCFECVGVILGTFTLILYKYLQILKRPPGSLIFMQLLILTLLLVSDIIYYVLYFEAADYTYITLFFYIYFNIAVVNYANCTTFEVLLRIRKSPMGKNYKRRVKLYHILCNLIAAIYLTLLLLFNQDYTKDAALKFHADKWVSWFVILVPCVQAITTFVTILFCMYYIQKERETPKARFMRSLVYYLFATTLAEIGHMLGDFLYYSTFTKHVYLYGSFCILAAALDVSVFIVRLLEHNVKEYLKESFIYFKLRLKYLKSSRKVNSMPSLMLNNSLILNSMFEDLKLEVIECQLIALSIIMFKSYFTLPALPANESYDKYIEYTLEAQETQCIKSHEITILNDIRTEQKYSDYYCEFKCYSPHIFKKIMYIKGISPSDIANSLLIQENCLAILSYIRDDNSETSLNFITADRKYIIKSITKKDQKKFTNEVLDIYLERLRDDSLLQYIYGLFKLLIKGKIYRLMILEHVESDEIYNISYRLSEGDSPQLVQEDYTAKFSMEAEEKERFYATFEKDKIFMQAGKILRCNIVMNASCFNEGLSRYKYAGKMNMMSRTMEIRITDLQLVKKQESVRRRRKRSSRNLNQATINTIEKHFHNIIV